MRYNRPSDYECIADYYDGLVLDKSPQDFSRERKEASDAHRRKQEEISCELERYRELFGD